MPPIRGPSNPPAMGQESYLTRDLLQNQGLQRKPRVWDHHGVKPKVCGQTREKRRVRMRKVYIYRFMCVPISQNIFVFLTMPTLPPASFPWDSRADTRSQPAVDGQSRCAVLETMPERPKTARMRGLIR